MRRLLLFIVVLSAVAGAAIALLVTQKQRLAPMSPEDRRAYLNDKLGSRLSDEQLDKLAEVISSKLDSVSTTEAVAEAAATEATEAPADVVSEEGSSESDV